jgi:hypothetical protein
MSTQGRYGDFKVFGRLRSGKGLVLEMTEYLVMAEIVFAESIAR